MNTSSKTGNTVAATILYELSEKCKRNNAIVGKTDIMGAIGLPSKRIAQYFATMATKSFIQ
jgi:hypothetical protein